MDNENAKEPMPMRNAAQSEEAAAKMATHFYAIFFIMAFFLVVYLKSKKRNGEANENGSSVEIVAQKEEKRKIRWLQLEGARDESGNLQAILRNIDDQSMPIPSVLPPEYEFGIKRIDIFFLDARALEFIKCILPRLNAVQLTMKMKMEAWDNDDERIPQIRCLLQMLASKIRQLEFGPRSNFYAFHRYFPEILDQVDALWCSKAADWDFDKLYNWLTKRQIGWDGKRQQKILELDKTQSYKLNVIERIQEEFSNAIEPANFLIYFLYGIPEKEFTLAENEKTGEVLTTFANGYHAMLLRCPKGEEDRWKKEARKKLLAFRHADATYVQLNDKKNIGTFNNLA